MKIRYQKDFAAGLMYMAVGLGFAVTASTYRMGTAGRMGPGFFPFWLGVLLAVVGAIVLLGSTRGGAEEDRLDRWDVKSLIIVIGSVIAFGVLLEPFGLVASVIVLVIASSFASHEFSWKTTLLNTFALLTISLVVFVYGLNLQIPVWPTFLGG